MTLVPIDNEYAPIHAYLEACATAHGSDTSILDNFAERYFGLSAPIYTTFIKRTLIAAVARIYQPGCKVDTTLILQGGQGVGKSSFFRVLAGADWFDDSLGSASDKDERLKLHRAWFIEWAELESIFKLNDIAQTKAFLSCCVDRLRRPYGRSVESLPRRSIIVGTTNQDEFLSDATDNHHFWIVPIHNPIDLEQLASERDRLWAAAVALFKAGERWHLSELESVAADLKDTPKNIIFVPIGTHAINLADLAKAEYSPVDPDSENDWIELHLLWKNGATTILYGDEADTIWALVQRLAGVPEIYPVNSLELVEA